MGKSGYNNDKGMPRQNPKDNSEEDFDWKEDLRQRQIEEKSDEEKEAAEQAKELDRLEGLTDLDHDYLEHE